MSSYKRLPDQPTYEDEDGVLRFVPNRIVEFLLEAGPFDMNQIAALPGITDEERAQFAQLIGYSCTGYSELSYVEDEPEG